jgi:phosphopantetheinyl transferase (holo-ACP synthase)
MESSTLSSRCEELSKKWGAPIVGHACTAWGSDQSNHRQLIQQKIQDLGINILKNSNYSISHTPGLGGFIASSTLRLGLDIERIGRLHLPVVKRICPAEFQGEVFSRPPHNFAKVLNPEQLTMIWAAKESAFKSLRGEKQPKVISQVQITHWELLGTESSGIRASFLFRFSPRFQQAPPFQQVEQGVTGEGVTGEAETSQRADLLTGVGEAWVEGPFALAISLHHHT